MEFRLFSGVFLKMGKIINIGRWLSLDISSGGAILHYFLCKKMFLPYEPIVGMALFFSILSIYTFDHLRDSLTHQNTSSQRRLIFQKNTNYWYVYLGLLLVVALTSLFFLPLQLIMWGLALGIFCVFYLLLSGKLSRVYSKELVAAALYSCGIFLDPILRVTENWLFPALLVIHLFLLAFANLVLIAMFELQEDRHEGFHSLVITFGYLRMKKVLSAILVLCMLTAMVGIASDTFPDIYVFYLLSALVLLLILLFPSWFRRQERYRVVADGIFFIPLFLL